MATYTLTLQQIIRGNIKVFDFDYPMFNEEYKPIFEKLFIDYFLTEEIAHETIGLFKHRLQLKLNLIMPYYNKLYMSQELEQRILDNYDVTEIINRVVTNDELKELLGETNIKSLGKQANNGNNSSKRMYKDTPKTKIDIERFDVVTNLTKEEDSINTSSTNNREENGKTTNKETSESYNVENYTRTMKGNIGVQTDADAIIKYWLSLKNVTLEILENELSQLFMGVF